MRKRSSFDCIFIEGSSRKSHQRRWLYQPFVGFYLPDQQGRVAFRSNWQNCEGVVAYSPITTLRKRLDMRFKWKLILQLRNYMHPRDRC